MRRQSLFLLIFIPLLLLLTLAQITAIQAAQRTQNLAVAQPNPASAQPNLPEQALGDPTPAVDAGVPLSQPLSIRIRQTVPITVLLDLFGAAGIDVPIAGTAQVTTSVTLTALDGITDTQLVTTVLPITLPAVSDLLADASSALTDTLPLTVTDAITDPGSEAIESLPLEVPDATPSATGALTTGAVSDVVTDTLGTGASELGASFPLTVELDLTVYVTQTMTSTVPALLTLRFAGLPTATLPIEVQVAPVSTALLFVEAITSTEGLTFTSELTDTLGVTGTEGITISDVVTVTGPLTVTPEPVVLTPVTVTVPVTANVRIDTSTNAEIVRTVAPGTVLTVVATNAGGDWLLLDDGNWLSVLVIGQAPAGLAVADEALVLQLREAAALAPPTPTPTPAPPTETPTPLPPSGPVTVTTTTNANLRAGPGTDFDIVGTTVLGQAITIVARNEAGDWLQLDNGMWISAALVAGLPPIETIALFDPNAPPALELIPTATPPAGSTTITETTVTTTTQVTTTTPVEVATPEPTPEAPLLPTPTPRPTSLTVDENLYLLNFDNINRNYQQALTAIDRLLDAAAGNTAIFDDAQWVTDMNTAVAILRKAGQDVAAMTVPERFAAAHNSLASAASAYTTGASGLEQGLLSRDTAQLDAGLQSLNLGDASLAQATQSLAQFRP